MEMSRMFNFQQNACFMIAKNVSLLKCYEIGIFFYWVNRLQCYDFKPLE